MEGSGSDDAGRSVGEEGSSSSVEHGSGGVDNGSVSNHRPVSHDVSGSVGNGRAGPVGRHAGVGHLECRMVFVKVELFHRYRLILINIIKYYFYEILPTDLHL